MDENFVVRQRELIVWGEQHDMIPFFAFCKNIADVDLPVSCF